MGLLLKWLGQLQRWPHARRLRAWRDRPMDAQWQVLRDILQRNRDTEYGTRYGFGSIGSIGDYQRAVPVVAYDDVSDYVTRMTRGERNVLTAEQPLYYCCTSGTTGTPKFNAITPHYRAQWQTAVHAFVYDLFRDHPRAGNHEVLYFVGSTRLGVTEDGTPYGTMSGYNYTTLPRVAQKLYAVPYEVFQIPDLDLKYYTLVRLAVTRRLSFCVAITPTPLISVARTLERNAEDIVRDVHDGSMRRAGELPSEIRAVLAPRMTPDPARARQLEALVRAGTCNATAVWPDIAVITCWIGAAAGMYVPELRACYPGVPLRDAIFSATEGWCNVPLRDDRPGGPLAIHSHFYEFIPEESYEADDRPVLTLDQLEPGKRYFILLTTGGGCYRYDLKDVMQVDDRWGAVPTVRFVYKGKHCSNLSGEKMTEGHVNEAIGRLRAARPDLTVVFFVAVPRQQSGDMGYDLYLEAEGDRAGVAEALDRDLQDINWEYGSHRGCGDLTALRVVPLAPGAWQRIRQSQTEAGANEAQMKPPHLTTNPSFVDLLAVETAND